MLEKARENMKLDLSAEYASVGPYTIQETYVYGLDHDVPNEMSVILDELNKLKGVNAYVLHTGVRNGYGHGREVISVKNDDGTVIYECIHVDHCDGPGYSCSYDHGPWFTYGSYDGPEQPNDEFLEAIELYQKLKDRFLF